MYLGIDVGTTVTKAAIFDESGALRSVQRQQTGMSNPAEGWFEQDPDEILRSVAAVVRAAVAEAGQQPEFIGLTGQGDGVWLADEHGRPVRPAISWMDARASGILRRWQQNDVVEKTYRHTGSALFPGAPAPILAWLAEHEPESLDRAATAGYCKDLVMQRLTGVRATDASEASVPFLDPHARSYDHDVLAWCGLATRADLLAPIAEPLPIGVLTGAGAELLGLPDGLPVTAGPFDVPACALGSGVVNPGEGHLIVGTTLACQVLLDALDTTGEPAGLTFATGTEGQWLRAMLAMMGCAAVDWVLDLVGETHDVLDDLLADSEPGARGVTCLPFFSPAGERAPFVEPGARAGFDHITVQSTKADLVRATCEAVAYAARHCFDVAGPTGEIAMCGGGTRSAAWLRIFADVLGRPIRLAPQPESGARGAVIAGATALGHDVDVAAWTAPEGVIEPDPATAARYTEGYADYRARVATARTRWKEHAS